MVVGATKTRDAFLIVAAAVCQFKFSETAGPLFQIRIAAVRIRQLWVKASGRRIVTRAFSALLSAGLSAADIDDLAFVEMSAPKLAKLAVNALG